MRILTVVGNRPQFVKAAAVSRLLRQTHDEVLIHTGQHHDDSLSAVFFAELGLPEPDHNLAIAGESNASQVARMLAALESTIAELAPRAVLVYGDTNSTLAAALAAADAGVEVVHVEAGMRSFDRTMAEERNRVIVDQLSALLLCSSVAAARNLEREACPGTVEVVGDVMADVAMLIQPRAAARTEVLAAHDLRRGEYLLVTAHRAANVDDPRRLRALVALLESIDAPLVLPLHPRTRKRLADGGLLERLDGAATLLDPLGYVDFATLLTNARAVLTDSGGVQKEAYLAGVPCLTLRESTEWTETVEAGWNHLVDLDIEAARTALAREAPLTRAALYGDGHAADRVVEALTLMGR